LVFSALLGAGLGAMLVAQPATEPMDKVLSHLCVGSLESANSEELLRRNGVTHCISVTTSHPSSHFPGIKYIHVDVQDDPAESIIKYFDPVHSAIGMLFAYFGCTQWLGVNQAL
jgi:hypothetical protein